MRSGFDAFEIFGGFHGMTGAVTTLPEDYRGFACGSTGFAYGRNGSRVPGSHFHSFALYSQCLSEVNGDARHV